MDHGCGIEPVELLLAEECWDISIRGTVSPFHAAFAGVISPLVLIVQ